MKLLFLCSQRHLLQFSHFFSLLSFDVPISQSFHWRLITEGWFCGEVQLTPLAEEEKKNNKRPESKSWHLLINSAPSSLLLPALRVREVGDKVIFR